ncbi:interferon alpha-17-like [Trichomycterus rosablanca]|uniref:interferon alpha-17-like n=1 Tax=Trichomycterus rosablanca TaxID=2290929 RepID=UPI002F354097
MHTLKCLLLMMVMSAYNAAVLPVCRWTQFRLPELNEESITLLESMGDLMPLKCLGKGGRSFPDDVFTKAQSEDLAVLALEMLKGVDKIFKNDQKPVSWNPEKLGLFKNIVFRQVEKLQECVGKEASQTDLTNRSSAKLKSYFEELEDRLRMKELSECAWEIVRNEVHYGLRKLHSFLQSKK